MSVSNFEMEYKSNNFSLKMHGKVLLTNEYLQVVNKFRNASNFLGHGGDQGLGWEDILTQYIAF